MLQQAEVRVIKLLEEKQEELHLVRKKFWGFGLVLSLSVDSLRML